MDGALIREQDEGEHQVVIFTFSGNVSQSKVREWNNTINTLKKSFAKNVVGVTIKGQAPPPKKRKAPRRRR
jgi:hypothetical protein